MTLSRSQRRTLLIGALFGVMGLSAMPSQAQNKIISAPAMLGYAKSRKVNVTAVFPATRIDSMNSVRGLKARIAKLLAPDPRDAKKSKAELAEERREIAEEMREQFTHRHAKVGDKAHQGPEEEKEGAHSAEWEAARLYQLQQRAFPNDRLDPSAPFRASQQRDNLQPANRVPIAKPNAANPNKRDPTVNAVVSPQPVPPAVPVTSNWEFIGPRNGISGSFSGRVNALAYDPTTPATVYLGAAKGGVWKTINGGTNWTPLTDSQFSLAISSIAVDYANPQNVYAGTGDFDGGDGVAFGILKSTDGGATWQVVGSELGVEAIHKITIDPVTPSKLFATAGTNGVFVSYDYGATWTRVLQSPVPAANGRRGRFSTVVYDGNQREIYAGADFDNIYHSTDGGNTWSVLPGAPTPTGRVDIAVSPLFVQTLYVLNGGAQNVMRRGYDQNNNLVWTTLPFPATPPGGRDFWSQKDYNFFIGCNYDVQTLITPPNTGRTVYHDNILVGLLDIFNSPNDGLAWQYSPDNHTDQHAIAFNPANPYEYVNGSDGGCFRTTFNPVDASGRYYFYPNPLPNPAPNVDLLPSPLPTFPARVIGRYGPLVNLNSTLGITQFYFGAFHPTNPVGLLGGSQDNGSPQSNNSTAWFDRTSGDGGGCTINQLMGNTQYASVYNLKILDPAAQPLYPINRTDDAWATYPPQDISLTTGDDITPFLATINANLANPNLVYLGTNYLAVYNANANVWTKLPQRLSDTTYVLAIGSSPTDASTVYAGLQDGKIFYSSNGGQTFQNITSNLPQRSITKIVVSGTNSRKLFVTVSGTGTSHVWRCDNAAAPFWTNISGSTPDTQLPDIYTNALAVVPNTNDQQIYVGTDIGVFSTVDGGTSWQNATVPLGLPNADIRELTAVPGTGYLMAATYGRGMWRLPLSATVPGAPTINLLPTLQGYRGDKTKLKVTATISVNSQILVTRTGFLTTAGTFTFSSPKSGTYDVTVTITGFLTKKYKNQNITGTVTLTGNFYNGDVNSDNKIDATDANIVKAIRIGTRVNGLPDVDGDGVITSNDLLLIQTNLGRVGD